MRDGRNVCPAILAVTSLWTFVARPAAVEQSVHSPSCTDSYLLALEKRIIDSHLPRAGTPGATRLLTENFRRCVSTLDKDEPETSSCA